MCFSDLMRTLQFKGLSVTGNQIRWALSTGKVSRPNLDGCLNFDFKEDHVEEIIDHFKEKQERRERKQLRKKRAIMI
jgi:hypothetical protein